MSDNKPTVNFSPRPTTPQRGWWGRRLIVFLGSSMGNYCDDEAVDLLSAVAAQLQPGGALLLGTDRRKDVPTMLQAYDDGAGRTRLPVASVFADVSDGQCRVSAQFDQKPVSRLGFGIRLYLGDGRETSASDTVTINTAAAETRHEPASYEKLLAFIDAGRG